MMKCAVFHSFLCCLFLRWLREGGSRRSDDVPVEDDDRHDAVGRSVVARRASELIPGRREGNRGFRAWSDNVS